MSSDIYPGIRPPLECVFHSGKSGHQVFLRDFIGSGGLRSTFGPSQYSVTMQVMPEVATVALVVVSEHRFAQLLDFHRQMLDVLRTVTGFSSLTLWKDADFQDQYRWLTVHSDAESATLGLTNWIESGGADRLVNELETTISSMSLKIQWKNGSDPARTSLNHAMSMSVRRAEPGFGADLEAEVHDVFENMTYMEGYLGSFYGPNESLPEELIGVAFWVNRMAFERSLPQRPPYELRLLERIA